MEKKNAGVAIAIIIVVVLLGIGLYNTEDTKTPMDTSNGLEITTLQPGSGDTAQVGDTVTVHYTGWLENGTKFDSSLDRGEPFSFTLGAGSVIVGWEEGVKGMRVGEKRKLLIPAELGYGASGAAGGIIPPNSNLVFEVELLKTER